jgi:hypothetical protein
MNKVGMQEWSMRSYIYGIERKGLVWDGNPVNYVKDIKLMLTYLLELDLDNHNNHLHVDSKGPFYQ